MHMKSTTIVKMAYIHVCETGHHAYKFGLIHLQVCLAKVIDILNIEHVHVYTLSYACICMSVILYRRPTN